MTESFLSSRSVTVSSQPPSTDLVTLLLLNVSASRSDFSHFNRDVISSYHDSVSSLRSSRLLGSLQIDCSTFRQFHCSTDEEMTFLGLSFPYLCTCIVACIRSNKHSGIQITALTCRDKRADYQRVTKLRVTKLIIFATVPVNVKSLFANFNGSTFVSKVDLFLKFFFITSWTLDF